MSLWKKLHTLCRASAQEPLEALVDTNSIRLFEQELRDAEQSISQSKRELACVIAEKNRLQRHNGALRENISNRENQARQALDEGEETLAMELADVIVQDEQTLKEQQHQLDCLRKQEAYLRKQLKQIVRVVAGYHSELRLARANQSAGNAIRQLRGHSRGLSSQMAAMEDSLSRIRRRQESFQDFDEALMSIEADYNGDALDGKLEEAGIGNGKPDTRAVLDRLRGDQATPDPC